MQIIINILIFIFILGTIILVHEFGHFITAKHFGVYCAEFSMGMGPSLWHHKKGETTYHIRLFPIGGYVAMAGEDDQEDNPELADVPPERTIKGIKTWQQIMVMGAGVFMNFVLAIVILFGLNMAAGSVSVDTNEIGTIRDDGAAVTLRLEAGDVITHIEMPDLNISADIATLTDLKNTLTEAGEISQADQNITITYDRDGHTATTSGQVSYNEEQQAYYLGVTVPVRRLSFTEAVQYTFSTVWEMATLIFTTLARLFTHTKETIGQLSGPAGIYQVTSQIAATGSIINLLSLVAMLSINIGVFNLMPVPGLDGAQILFAVVEKIIGHPIPVKLRYYLQIAGLALVFGLMIVVTIQDLGRIF